MRNPPLKSVVGIPFGNWLGLSWCEDSCLWMILPWLIRGAGVGLGRLGTLVGNTDVVSSVFPICEWYGVSVSVLDCSWCRGNVGVILSSYE